MQPFNRKNHWEAIYQTKVLQEVSWYQATPDMAIHFLDFFQVPKHAKIIDIGGGDSLLADYLLDLGYSNITVLDISEKALERAKGRLGTRANQVHWIVADVAQFRPTEQYDFWYDRATFHFLTQEEDVKAYLLRVEQGLKPGGILVIGTFSEQGPSKCSGIDIQQYSAVSLSERFSPFFKTIKCLYTDHQTPSGEIQNFVFCSFTKVD